MSSTPSWNASSIFSSDSGHITSDELSSTASSCDHHQILITKFLVSTFFMIFYFTSFLQGPHISLLSDIDIWRHSLSLHGIPSFNLTLNDCRYALIYHIFEGFRYNFELDISCASHRPDRTGCCCLARGFTSRETMTMNAIDSVLFADAKIISTDWLRILAQALKLPG